MKLKRSTTAFLSCALVPTLVLLAVPTRAADSTSSFSGAIVRAVDQSPLEGARLHVGDPKTDRLFSTEPTGRDGSFELTGLPAATYELAVEANGGLYVVQTPVVLPPGSAQTLHVAISPAMATGDDPDGGGSGGRGRSFLKHPAVATLLTLGLAAIIGTVLQEDNPPRLVSPVEPEQ